MWKMKSSNIVWECKIVQPLRRIRWLYQAFAYEVIIWPINFTSSYIPKRTKTHGDRKWVHEKVHHRMIQNSWRRETSIYQLMNWQKCGECLHSEYYSSAKNLKYDVCYHTQINIENIMLNERSCTQITYCMIPCIWKCPQ